MPISRILTRAPAWLAAGRRAATRIFQARRVEPLWKHVLLAAPLGLLPGIAMVAGFAGLVALAGGDPSLLLGVVRPAPVFLSVVVGPLLETGLLAMGLWLVRLGVRERRHAALLSALCWGALHVSDGGVLRFFGTVVAFYVFGCSYLAWRVVSFRAAFVAAAVPHALNNLAAELMVFLDH